MNADNFVLLIPIVAVAGPMVLVGFCVFCKAMTHVLCHWRDVGLKIRLVEAGLSAAEIEQVIAAGRPDKVKGLGNPRRNALASMKSSIDKPPVKVGV